MKQAWTLLARANAAFYLLLAIKLMRMMEAVVYKLFAVSEVQVVKASGTTYP